MKASQVIRSIVLATSILLTSLVASATLPVRAADTASTSVARFQGPQPFLFVLCKFAGEPAEPESPAFFENMLGGSAPSLADYWRQVSSGQITLDGSEVAGWYTLPEPATSYTIAAGAADRERLAAACMKLAQADQNLASYSALGLVFNANLELQPRAGPDVHRQ